MRKNQVCRTSIAAVYERSDPDDSIQEEKEIATANLRETEDDNGSSSAEDSREDPPI